MLREHDEAHGMDAIDDIATTADFVEQVVIQKQPDILKDEHKRWEVGVLGTFPKTPA